jgi:putative transposase
MGTSLSIYHRHRFPVEIISHCVWLYFRFPLSFRDVEEMLAMRGVSLSYVTVREWCLKFGQTYANGLRHKSPRPGNGWLSFAKNWIGTVFTEFHHAARRS